jgi:amino acid transporter
MTPFQRNLLILVGVSAVVGGIGYAVRRFFPKVEHVDQAPWSSTLSYVATAYGVVVGFSILFLFGQFASARSAVGDEATSIGTAFEQSRLFPESTDGVQRALICYARSVPEYDWPAMRAGTGGAPEVDHTYNDLVGSLGQGDQPTTGALPTATATNLASQVGSISTARETRLVAAETSVPRMLWLLLLAGAAFVVVLIFVVTVSAAPGTQAVLVGASAFFTAVLILLVFALSRPYSNEGGAVNPKLIQQTTASMEQSAPDLAKMPCPVTP